MARVLFVKALTQAQAQAGNYKKKHIRWNGLEISIENAKGSVRRGKGPGGKEWKTTMVNDYGYIRRTLGVDGDHVDCYIGPDKDSVRVYVVHQRKAGDWKKFDEDKCMLGFESKEAAKEAYLKHYDDPRFLGPITDMSVDEFKDKVRKTFDKPRMIKALFLSWPVQIC